VCAAAYFIKFLERRDVIISQGSQGISSCLKVQAPPQSKSNNNYQPKQVQKLK